MTDLKPKTTKTYRWIGNHVQDFQSGKKVLIAGPGETVELTFDDLGHSLVSEFIKNGLLLESTGGGNGGTE